MTWYSCKFGIMRYRKRHDPGSNRERARKRNRLRATNVTKRRNR